MNSLVASQAIPNSPALAHSLEKAPVRVLFLSHTAAQGGAEIALLNLVRHLDRTKIVPIVVFASDGPMVDKISPFAETHVLPLSRSVVDARKDKLGLGSILRIRSVFAAASYAWALANFVRQHQIDVLHTNTLKAHILGTAAARLSRRRIVWHMRDRIENDYLPPMVVRLYRWLCRSIPDFVIANSQATLQSLRLNPRAGGKSSSPDSARRSFVVHDGTHLATPKGNAEARSREAFQVALIGRVCPWKGQHILIQAAALVHQRFPAAARFLIVGAPLFGEMEYDREIRQLAETLHLNDVVSFTGFCSDIPALISTMDLIVHASTTGEPFGQVIIEAMSGGKPVVATNGGGVPEIVDDGKTGILVPMGDAGAMAEAICRLIADPVLANEMGASGRQRVREHFTIELTARKVEAIYQESIQPKICFS
jgi:glycosyltransferase involved in cell wall biosynthesis